MGKSCFLWSYEGSRCKKPKERCKYSKPPNENYKTQKEKCKLKQELYKYQKKCDQQDQKIVQKRTECIRTTASAAICIKSRKKILRSIKEKASMLVFSNESIGQLLFSQKKSKSYPIKQSCNEKSTKSCRQKSSQKRGESEIYLIENSDLKIDKSSKSKKEETQTKSYAAKQCTYLERRKKGKSQGSIRSTNKEQIRENEVKEHTSENQEQCNAQIKLRGDCQYNYQNSRGDNPQDNVRMKVKKRNRTKGRTKEHDRTSYKCGDRKSDEDEQYHTYQHKKERYAKNYEDENDKYSNEIHRETLSIDKCLDEEESIKSTSTKRSIQSYQCYSQEKMLNRISKSQEPCHRSKNIQKYSDKKNHQTISSHKIANEDEMIKAISFKSLNATQKRTKHSSCDSFVIWDTKKSGSLKKEHMHQRNEQRKDTMGRFGNRQSNGKIKNEVSKQACKNIEIAGTLITKQGVSRIRKSRLISLETLFGVKATKCIKTESNTSVGDAIARVDRRWNGCEDGKKRLNISKKIIIDFDADSKETFICKSIRQVPRRKARRKKMSQSIKGKTNKQQIKEQLKQKLKKELCRLSRINKRERVLKEGEFSTEIQSDGSEQELEINCENLDTECENNRHNYEESKDDKGSNRQSKRKNHEEDSRESIQKGKRYNNYERTGNKENNANRGCSCTRRSKYSKDAKQNTRGNHKDEENRSDRQDSLHKSTNVTHKLTVRCRVARDRKGADKAFVLTDMP